MPSRLLRSAATSGDPDCSPAKHCPVTTMPTPMRVQLCIPMHPTKPTRSILPTSMRPELQQLVPSCRFATHRRLLPAINDPAIIVPVPNWICTMR
ncbi:unnamed protein product [Cylicostephanus goldi]|uniref:Uncharacterized protein n=1 Tax=Cylicostephanus goldi TaxID=71465 RepID=A0A3P6RB61_CYLGO|nr:unnamed protein product [Cylicostephanus goldi]